MTEHDLRSRRAPNASGRAEDGNRMSAGGMTNLLHRFETHTPFERQLQRAELAYIAGSRTGSAMIAENYEGPPFEDE
jgi:hypothetical protein